jgi:hypothetical protein
MIIPFSTKTQGFFVKLPYGAYDIYIQDNSLKYKVIMFGNKEEEFSYFVNKELSKHEILGFANDLTNCQKEKVVDYWVSISGDGSKVYEKYTEPNIPKYTSADDSFNSLLKSLNILLENPYLPYSNATEHVLYMEEAKRYFEAREKTGNWICIIGK